MALPTNLRATGGPRIMDPLLGFKFVVLWDGQAVAGVRKVGALKRTTEKVGYGNDPSPVIPGQTTYEPVTLERGLIVDVTFEQWANKVWFYERSGALGSQVSLADLRKEITIQLRNQAGQVMKQYRLFNCWPSAYDAVSELDATGNEVAFESLTLETEGWQRDDSFTAPPPLDGYPSFEHPRPPGSS